MLWQILACGTDPAVDSRTEGPTEPPVHESAEPLDSEPGGPDSDPPESCSVDVPPDELVAVDTACVDGATTLNTDLMEIFNLAARRYAPTWTWASRMHDGDGDGDIDVRDPMQLVGITSNEGARIYDHQGELEALRGGEARQAWGALGDVDASDPGDELVLAWYIWRDDHEYVQAIGDDGTRWSVEVPSATYVAVTDLEGGGTAEVLHAGVVYDKDGNEKARLDVEDPEDPSIRLHAADLDLDGTSELVALLEELQTVALFSANGSRRATCHEAHNEWAVTAVGIADLDTDPEGEVLVAGDGFVFVCDHDGTKARSAPVEVDSPTFVAIGQLDEDEAAEILLGGRGDLVALDNDLSEIWRVDSTCQGGFSLADLDRDGLHEVILAGCEDVSVLGPDGDRLAFRRFSSLRGHSALRQPVVADIDGDGLAEIIVGGSRLAAVEPASGGWSLPQASNPWTDGRPTDSNSWWTEHNVYNGLPPGPGPGSDVAISMPDLCVDADKAVLTVRVEVLGPRFVLEPVDIVLSVDGEEVARTTLEELDPGQARHVVFQLTPDQAGQELSASIETTSALSECGHDHVATR